MKIASAALALFLVAGSAYAADEATRPDYTKDGLQRVFAVDLYEPGKPQPYDWERVFIFDWSALGTGFHFRPALAPLYGSVPLTTGMPTPNPFILTGTEYAYTPRTWHDQRALNAERKKVEKIIRKHAKIKVVAE